MAWITAPCYYGNTAQQHHSTCYHDDFGASATEDQTFLTRSDDWGLFGSEPAGCFRSSLSHCGSNNSLKNGQTASPARRELFYLFLIIYVYFLILKFFLFRLFSINFDSTTLLLFNSRAGHDNPRILLPIVHLLTRYDRYVYNSISRRLPSIGVMLWNAF